MASSLAIKLTLLCSGKDAKGQPFEERTHTTAIEESGGKLLTQHKLSAGARLELRLLARPDRATEVTLKDPPRSTADGTEWSFAFVTPQDDFWGVRFPGKVAPEQAEGSSQAAAQLAEASEHLVLLTAHTEDHLRYCTQELEGMRQRFARELQSALEAGARQLQQLARSTMQTTFRSLLEDLAHRAEETVEDSLNNLRKAIDETRVAQTKYLDEEAETQLTRFQERLDKQGRQLLGRVEQLQAEAERALHESTQEALANFHAGCAALLRGLLESSESHKPVRPTPPRRK